MKNPMKLWPFRPATRAGQNAIAIHETTFGLATRISMLKASIHAGNSNSSGLSDRDEL
jgi:hypothetical protein